MAAWSPRQRSSPTPRAREAKSPWVYPQLAQYGDSGGPNLLGGTDIILAINSNVTNGSCAGVKYSNRIDTFIQASPARSLPK